MENFGTLTLGAVPIGDHKDSSINLINYIINHKIILVESLEAFENLCQNLKIKTNAKIVNYGNHDKKNINQEYIDILKNGTDILFLSDEGTAGLIDPGGQLMDTARNNNIKVKVMAGPNSVIPSIILARFHRSFYFHGPSPDREDRRKSFSKLSNYEFPMVFNVSLLYIKDFIDDAKEYFGLDRKVFVACNLTKDNEFTIFTTLNEISNFITYDKINFSITLVIDGKGTI